METGDDEWQGPETETKWLQPVSLAPWERTSASPSAEFLVKTELRDSTVGPDSGLGRFSAVDLSEGQVIRSGPLVSARTYLEGGLPSIGGIIVNGEKDIADLLQSWSGDRARFADFLTGVPAIDNDQGVPVMYIASSSAFINHDEMRANLKVVVRNGICHLLAMQNIDAGQELLLDYRSMYISSEVKLYFARFGLVDVVTLSQQLSTQIVPAPLQDVEMGDEDSINLVLAGYCQLQTEVYGLKEVSKEKVLAIRLIIDRILCGELPGQVVLANPEPPGSPGQLLGCGIFFKTHQQAVSPDSSYAPEKHPYVWLHFFFAAKHARRMGLFDEWFDAGEKFAKDSGCGELRADVAQHNIECSEGLKKRGFHPESTVWRRSNL